MVLSAAVYSCVGKPTEDDVQVCLDALLNMPFKKAFRELERKQVCCVPNPCILTIVD